MVKSLNQRRKSEILDRINTKTTKARKICIIIKSLEINNDKIIKRREKQHITCCETDNNHKHQKSFNIKTMKWYLSTINQKFYTYWIYLSKIRLNTEFFTIKQKLKKFVSSHFVLQKIIQTILQAEKIRYKIKSITKKGIKISEMVNVW